jgi:hypothetical protein
MKNISPWQPTSNKVDLAVLGKLSEELGEAQQIVARCIIQGIWESDPITGETNIEMLEKELADVEACTGITIERFDLDYNKMSSRIDVKEAGFRHWHTLIKE